MYKASFEVTLSIINAMPKYRSYRGRRGRSRFNGRRRKRRRYTKKATRAWVNAKMKHHTEMKYKTAITGPLVMINASNILQEFTFPLLGTASNARVGNKINAWRVKWRAYLLGDTRIGINPRYFSHHRIMFLWSRDALVPGDLSGSSWARPITKVVQAEKGVKILKMFNVNLGPGNAYTTLLTDYTNIAGAFYLNGGGTRYENELFLSKGLKFRGQGMKRDDTANATDKGYLYWGIQTANGSLPGDEPTITVETEFWYTDS